MDIKEAQEIEDEIAWRFARMQGVNFQPATPRNVIEAAEVRVSSDFYFDKFGLVEIKFTRRWCEEIGFKSYQLKQYASQGAKILFINNWLYGPKFALLNGDLLYPTWILANGSHPSEQISNLFKPPGSKTGKFDIVIYANQVEWHKLL